MAHDKVTTMVLNVDLQCTSCYKKVKKLLSKFPEIRDQIYNEKLNTVTINVISCCPEKIRDKLRGKGGKTIKSIEIKPPPKPKEPEKPKSPKKPKEPEKSKAPEKPKESEKTKTPEKPKEPEKTKAPEKPKEPEKTKAQGASKPAPDPVPAPESAPKAPEPAPKAPEPVPMAPEPAPPLPTSVMQVVPAHGYPSIFPYEAFYEPCYEVRAVGPFYPGYGKLEPYYDNYGYRNYGYGLYGGGRPCYYYPSEENTPTCTIM